MKLYVGNLPFSTTEEELREIFSSHGTVGSVHLKNHPVTGQPRGFGFVEFESDDEAKAAIDALNGHELGGRALVVNEARPQTERPRRDGGHSGSENRDNFNSFRKRNW